MRTDLGQLTDEDVLAGLDSEWVEPCEMTSHEHIGGGPAKWVMWFSCCHGGTGAPYILACDGCKEHKLTYPCLKCPACGSIFTPGSLAYRYIEALNKS